MADMGIQLIACQETIDIQPTSWFGDGVDTASITTTYIVADPREASSLASFVDGNATGSLVSARTEISIEQTADTFAIHRVMPPFGELGKGAQFTLAITLPATTVLATGEAIIPMLGSFTRDPAPQVFDGLSLPLTGARTSVAWQGFQDPDFDLEYVYRKIRQPS